MLSGFRDFIAKGNLVDLAVPVIIGTAFTAVVNALVGNVLMPLIAGVVGSPNFDSFAVWSFRGNEVQFGVLLTALVNFLLVAAVVYFLVVLPMNRLIALRNRRLQVDETETPDAQVALLTEIRDLLGHGAGRRN